MTAHFYPTCAACLAPTDSTKHDAECVAPLVVLCGESPVVAGDSRRTERDLVAENGYDGGTNKDGPRPAASTAGSSQGLADRHLRSVID